MINQQALQEFPTISKDAAESLKDHSGGQTQWWRVSVCTCLSWKVPTAIWVPKCCKFIANILVSILPAYIAVMFRKTSRNLDHWSPITCMAELCKATVFSQAALIISYISVILRKRLDHEVTAVRSFTWVWKDFYKMWQIMPYPVCQLTLH